MEEALTWPFLIEDDKPWRRLAWRIRYLVKANTCHFPTTACSWLQPGSKHRLMPRALDANAFCRGFQTSNLGQRVNIGHLRQPGGLENDGEQRDPATPPPHHRFWHWVRNGLVGLDPQKVWPDVASWWEEACESHSFDHTGPSPPILSSTKLWKQKAFHHPFSSKPDLMWGFLRLCKQSHVVWMFCYSYIVLSDGVVPQSPRGVLCYPHMHYLTDLKFETCEPWNQWAPRVWIKIVGL